MFGLNLVIRLPVSFAPNALYQDLLEAEKFQFSAHPLKYHDGTWKTINLVYSGGQIEYRHEGAFGFGDKPPQPTEVLERCPYFQRVISDLPGRVIMARLSALPAGGRIHRHYDPKESVDFGHWRVHIPITTHNRVKFYLGYRRRRWRPGEAWLGDFTFPHSVHNESTINRVHMIVDLEPSEQMLGWLPEGFLSTAARARRAKLRKWQRAWWWYHQRLTGTRPAAPAKPKSGQAAPGSDS